MADGADGVKNKNSPIPKRDEGCCIKLRGTTQISKDKTVPCRFRRINAALRPTFVRRKLRGGAKYALPERLAACGRSLWTAVRTF